MPATCLLIWQSETERELWERIELTGYGIGGHWAAAYQRNSVTAVSIVAGGT